MTLWDFYRTLPYPLPIKDELDEMSPQDQKPWLSLLVNRFENTEAYAKAQLNVPLNAIFAHSEPRKKSANDEVEKSKNNEAKLFRKSSAATSNHLSQEDSDINHETPRFDPAAYDKNSNIECDERNNAIIIPNDSNDYKSKTDNNLSNHKGDIITEADNPTVD